MMNGHDVKRIRRTLRITQVAFANQFRINLYTLRQWERKGNTLDSAVAAYMSCIDNDAAAILNCLQIAEEEPIV